MTMLTASFDRAEEGAYDRMTQAWQWLCEQRTQAPDHADVWDIRWQNLNTGERWLTDLTERVLRGEYRLTPLQLQGTGEQRQAVWGAQDALVLKWVALSLQCLLPLHPSCEPVKGHGGGKQYIEKLHSLLTAQSVDSEKKTAAGTTPDAAEIRHYKWGCRTDIRGYYRNINKQTLIQQVRQHVTAPVLRDLVQQYIHYTVEHGGTFHTPEKGISPGCPLSPLMGALHLFDMDEHFSNQPNIHYARYMDDIIILAKTRWSLRKHTKRLMQWFGEYGFEAHPDKTQISRVQKGFDWMGDWLTHEGVTDIAPRAKENHREKVRRLYEQLVRLSLWKRKSAAPKVNARVSTYRKRWNIWTMYIGSGQSTISAVRTVIISGFVLMQSAAYATDYTLSGNPDGRVVRLASTADQTVYVYGDNGRIWGGISAWYMSKGSAIYNTYGTGYTYKLLSTALAQKCGLGVQAIVDGYGPTSYANRYVTWENINGGSSSVNRSYHYELFSLGYADADATTCAVGTVIASICVNETPGYGATTKPSGTMYTNQSKLASSCPSGSTEDRILLGRVYTPPEKATCSIDIIPPSGVVLLDDVTPAASTSTVKGSVISLGENITLTSKCSTSKGDVNVSTTGTYVTTNSDFASAGFDVSTATYVGLLLAGNTKASLGSVVTNADLWTKTTSSASPQVTNLIPVVIRGANAPQVGNGQVTMTVSAVAP